MIIIKNINNIINKTILNIVTNIIINSLYPILITLMLIIIIITLINNGSSNTGLESSFDYEDLLDLFDTDLFEIIKKYFNNKFDTRIVLCEGLYDSYNISVDSESRITSLSEESQISNRTYKYVTGSDLKYIKNEMLVQG